MGIDDGGGIDIIPGVGVLDELEEDGIPTDICIDIGSADMAFGFGVEGTELDDPTELDDTEPETPLFSPVSRRLLCPPSAVWVSSGRSRLSAFVCGCGWVLLVIPFPCPCPIPFPRVGVGVPGALIEPVDVLALALALEGGL